ncbi:metal dependent phosphohydrolase [Denitrovibrio acetiphilus DSM 12809]|uniref:Metal dependent phosphohydrolase n=1 Tax=Denitrovibrio acetiphilus (strain DSM 12809 / NBRC 114555 / N2460) TaxID=522772 RepID=D4H477_DENA2|nr:metal-dependent hydrolase [Denitrovibrio acetiphilus]ADD67388.1 metal dependent phosphohydrolase [Denitrovibrio acetiphilus DSM 12809]
MKLRSHVIAGMGYVLATGAFEPAAVAAIGAGSIFPDIVDSIFGFGSEKFYRKIHRKISHWWVLYTLPLAAILFSDIGGYAFYYFLIGGLLHIFCDSFTRSGVPFINPFKAGHGFRLFNIGSPAEYLTLFLIVLTLIALGLLFPYPVWFFIAVVLPVSLFSGADRTVHQEKKEPINIHLSELAPLWTGQKTVTAEIIKQSEDTTVFAKPELMDFYNKHVANLPESAKNVIRLIMTMLDEKGDTPSVVKRSGEINFYEEPNTFTALAKVPLYLHSLHVAEEILKLFDKPGAYAAQLIMTALGHDLGKIESLDKFAYSMGDHPKISVVVLNSFEGFDDLKYKADIENAILSHHRTGGGDLAEKLREANRNARQKELADNLVRVDEDASETHNSNEVKEKPSDLEWLNITEFLTELDKRINVLNGSRFEAFSMKDGCVYFQTEVFWKVIKMLARRREHDEILLADSDQQQRRNYINTITEMLREKRLIADGIIRQEHFTAPFTVTYKDGKSTNKAYYTPMMSGAFGDISELESRKSGILMEIETVAPKYGDNQ